MSCAIEVLTVECRIGSSQSSHEIELQYLVSNEESYNRAISNSAFRKLMTGKVRFVARMWYYFRIGYATYLTFLLGVINTLVVVWYLAIAQMPEIQNIFGHFISFAILATVVGVPLGVAMGWLHIKRTPGYTSEVDIGVEANPYYYKLPPGYNREAFAPLYLELLTQLSKLLEAQNLLTKDDKSRIEALEGKLQLLIDGGYVGTPRTKI